MPERFALYFAPAPTDPLDWRAAQWLGRDPAGGAVTSTEIAGIAPARRRAVSESARRYGFHATLKAPMALADGTTRADLDDALRHFGATRKPIGIGRLVLASIDGFLALVPARQTEELTAFVSDVTIAFDRFRAPLAAAERERRIHHGLTPRQIELLDRYGYPSVMEEFRFHMTLTDRLVEDDRDEIRRAAEDWFAPALEREYKLDCVSLFHEPAAGHPFDRIADFPLTAEATVDA